MRCTLASECWQFQPAQESASVCFINFTFAPFLFSFFSSPTLANIPPPPPPHPTIRPIFFFLSSFSFCLMFYVFGEGKGKREWGGQLGWRGGGCHIVLADLRRLIPMPMVAVFLRSAASEVYFASRLRPCRDVRLLRSYHPKEILHSCRRSHFRDVFTDACSDSTDAETPNNYVHRSNDSVS